MWYTVAIWTLSITSEKGAILLHVLIGIRISAVF